jgi:hypothetical protein
MRQCGDTQPTVADGVAAEPIPGLGGNLRPAAALLTFAILSRYAA